jgi:hypothetical protein
MSPVVEETAQTTQPEVDEKKEVEKDPSQVVADALSAFPGSPSRDQIEAWKQQFGEVFCSGFAETELYMWRPVGRAEFVNLQAQLSQAEKPMTNLDAEEMVVEMCMLWCSEPGKKALTQKAGSLTALHEQIMSNSNFMDPRLATALVIKL